MVPSSRGGDGGGECDVTVVATSTGAIVATILADATNLLQQPTTAAFDGERVLITNQASQSVTIFKAADLSLVANVPTGSAPHGACSDGINFWVTLGSSGTLLRI